MLWKRPHIKKVSDIADGLPFTAAVCASRSCCWSVWSAHMNAKMQQKLQICAKLHEIPTSWVYLVFMFRLKHRRQSLNWCAAACFLCFCIRQYFGWWADTGNRDQLLRACVRFWSSSLVTISCKGNRKKRCDQRKVEAEGSGCLPVCHSVSTVTMLQVLSLLLPSPRG